MPKPTDIQRQILAHAATRPDGAVLPIPEVVKAKGAALQRSLDALRRHGWIAQESAAAAEIPCGRAEEGLSLVITSPGRAAIGLDAAAAPGSPRLEAPRPDRPKGKLGLVLGKLEAPGGATLSELMVETGWLPHSTRAALTQLRKRGFAIALGEQDGRKAYRIVPAAA